MKTFCSAILVAVLVGLAGRADASTYTTNFTGGFANGGLVPDGSTIGWSDTRTLSGITDGAMVDVNVFLNISGGYNGDFFAYLTHDDGFSVLLNRAGRTSADPFGFGDAGLNVTFDDSAASGDFHLYQMVAGYPALIGNGSAWSPDGRNVSPLEVLDSSARTSLLGQFNGLNPKGNWTLYVADLSGGDQGAVVSWGLDITAVAAVPEPSALCFCGLGLTLLVAAQRRFRA